MILSVYDNEYIYKKGRSKESWRSVKIWQWKGAEKISPLIFIIIPIITIYFNSGRKIKSLYSGKITFSKIEVSRIEFKVKVTIILLSTKRGRNEHRSSYDAGGEFSGEDTRNDLRKELINSQTGSEQHDSPVVPPNSVPVTPIINQVDLLLEENETINRSRVMVAYTQQFFF